MLIKGDLDISGENRIFKYSAMQTVSGFGQSINKLDFETSATKIITLTGVLGNTVTFTGVNYSPFREIKALLTSTGIISSVIYPSDWIWASPNPTGFFSGERAILNLISTSNNDAGVWAYWISTSGRAGPQGIQGNVTGGVQNYMVTGDPNGLQIGNSGDLAWNIVEKYFYVKESGFANATGWMIH
jgi:hypothetical protein